MLRIFSDDRCLEHSMPPGFPETAERLLRVRAALSAHAWAVPASCSHDGAEEAVAAVHDPRYVERFRKAVERGDGLLDSSDNPLSEGTWPASWAAIECILEAADWIADGADRSAFVATRPPGHHAERALAMGFCYFNNVAVAADYLRRRRGVERVAIFDFDVHHGNGTQHLFEDRADVLYASTHQYPFYPGTGRPKSAAAARVWVRRSTCRSRQAPATPATRRRSTDGSCRRSTASDPMSFCCRRDSTPGATTCWVV